jgi:hypothetical protein
MALAFLVTLALYAFTAAPTVLFGDSAEFQVVALRGGIPHATGYPLYVLVGRLFAWLPFPDPAFRINLMSAFFGAATVALVVLIIVSLGVSARAAVVGALTLGLSFTFWRVSQRAEVYTFGMFLGMLALWRSLVALRSTSFVQALIAGFLLGLTLTVHLSFILPVAGLGLMLAWHTARQGGAWPLRLTALLAVFVLALTPYLYLMWADTQHYPFNYLRLMQMASSPMGEPMPHFGTPAQRIGTLIISHNQYPPPPFVFHLGPTLKSVLQSGFIVFGFELGPVALPFFLIGLLRRGGIAPGLRPALVLFMALSLIFSVLEVGGAILHLCLPPLFAVAAMFVAAGIEPLLDAIHPGPAVIAIGALAVIAIAAPPHLVRVWAASHPLTRFKFHVSEEDTSLKAGMLPNMHGFREPRRYGEEALKQIPPNALVVGGWSESMNLVYFRAIEGKRPDLTLAPMSDRTLAEQLALWQRDHSVAERPFAFLSPPSLPDSSGLALDSLPAADRWIYIQRAPLRLPPLPDVLPGAKR